MGTVDEIRALEERLRQGDLDPSPDTSSVFDELLADDVLFVQAPGNSVGKAGVLRGHQPPRKRTFSKVENHEVEIRDLGSTVAVSCRTDYAIQERAFSLRALRLWKRAGTSWKVAVVALMEVPKDEA
ncbi:MAG TPA: nuclear transport factor 2 family protein [Thermoplasmata archaeon]|nr:nuclear transport factor 2 family protein [Thermoplasmata archaeon]